MRSFWRAGQLLKYLLVAVPVGCLFSGRPLSKRIAGTTALINLANNYKDDRDEWHGHSCYNSAQSRTEQMLIVLMGQLAMSTLTSLLFQHCPLHSFSGLRVIPQGHHIYYSFIFTHVLDQEWSLKVTTCIKLSSTHVLDQEWSLKIITCIPSSSLIF